MSKQREFLYASTLAGFVVAAGCAADDPSGGTSAATDSAQGTDTLTTGDATEGSGPSGSASGSGPGSGSNTEPGESSESVDGSSGPSESSETGDPPLPPTGLCGMAPPDGAQMPAPLPVYTGGTCPSLGPGLNAITSSGNARTFHVVVPSDLQPGETLPVAFLWHWLGGSATDFIEKADAQNAVDQLRFIAIAPEEKGDLLFRWPFSAADSDARMQEEFVFFDDMLACVAESYPIDNACVTSVGVSAGALFTSQLGWGRGDYLSSISVLSGGTGGLAKPWNGSPHIMPALVLWGGPDDNCAGLFSFVTTSQNLESSLQADGHPVVECIHNCGHSEPPFTAPEGLTPYTGMWQFFLDHPFWLEDGETPWSTGTPEALPEWCALGVGAATPRMGECENSSAC